MRAIIQQRIRKRVSKKRPTAPQNTPHGHFAREYPIAPYYDKKAKRHFRPIAGATAIGRLTTSPIKMPTERQLSRQ